MLKELRAANVARDKEWLDGTEPLGPSWRGNELAGEVGEACNILKKLDRERLGLKGSRSTVDALAEELADVIICTDLAAMDYNIDLEKAVSDKFNATSDKVGLRTQLFPSPFSKPLIISALEWIAAAAMLSENSTNPDDKTMALRSIREYATAVVRDGKR